MIKKQTGFSTQVKNMSIIEDLGMIHYVFADKTGTLTQNQMEFHSMCVGMHEFGPVPLHPGVSGAEEQMCFDFEKFDDFLLGTM